MKKIILTLIATSIFGFVNAQTEEADSIKVKKNSVEIGSEGVKIHIGTDSTEKVKTVKTEKFPNVSFGFNFEHFDFGLSKYHIGGDFSTPAGYEFLEYNNWKTHTVGFDALQFGVRFNPYFKIMLAAGIDWNHIRLEQNVNIVPDNAFLISEPAASDDLKKNRFSSRYVRLPLYFEYRTKQIDNGKRLSIVAGPEVGFLIDGKLKQKTDGGEKTKVKDDFNFEPFRYGANVRLGYGGAGLFFKYYFNDVFAKNTAPGLEDFKNLSFGLTLGF